VTVLLHARRQPLLEAFREILDAFWADLDWNRGVFLKPNIVFAARPDSGAITPPALVATLVRALRERDGSLDIVMGDGVAVGRDPRRNFQVSGYARLSRDLDVPLVDLHEAERAPVAWDYGELAAPAVALDRVYVNLPILKYSSACIISGALKNQKGILLPEVKKEYHRLGLHERIAALNAAVRPSLTIMDCSRFFGPNVLISGDNCGEVDAAACRLLGIDQPEHVRLSRQAGVFEEGFSVVGEEGTLERIAARPAASEAKTLGRLRLWSNPQACTGCRALLADAKADLLRPGNFRAKRKLIGCSVKGAEMIMGRNAQWREEHDTVFCVGSCTRDVAREHGYIYVPGCPPDLNDLYGCLP